MKIKEKSRERIHRAFDGAAALAIATVMTKVLGLLYKVPLSRILGDEGMGYFNSAYTVYTFFYILCSSGVPKAVTIVVSGAGSEKRAVDERKTVKSALKAFFVIGLLSTVIFVFGSEKICELIGNRDAVYTMLAIAPTVLFVSVAGVAKGHLNGNSRLVPIAVSQIIEGAAKFFLGVLFAVLGEKRGMSLPYLSAFTVLGITLGSAASAVFLLICSKNTDTKRSFSLQNQNGTSVLKIIKIAAPLTVGAAVMSLSNMIDLGMIMTRLRVSGYSTAEASALYGNYTTLAVPMFNLVTALVSPFFIAALPILTRTNTQGDKRGFTSELRIAIKKSFFIAVPATFAFTFYSEEILSLIFTKEAAEKGAPLLTLLAPTLIFLTGQTLVNTALESKGFYKAPIISMLLGTVPKVILSYFLISNPAVGISGAPIGTLVCYAVGFAVSSLVLFRCTDIRIPFLRELIKPAVISAVSVLLTQIVKKLVNVRQTYSEGVFIAAFFCIFYIGLYIISLFFAKKIRNNLAKYTKTSTVNYTISRNF